MKATGKVLPAFRVQRVRCSLFGYYRTPHLSKHVHACGFLSQRSANYCPLGKSDIPSVFLNSCIGTRPRPFMNRSSAAGLHFNAEVRARGEAMYMAHKAWNIHYLVLYRKHSDNVCTSTSGLTVKLQRMLELKKTLFLNFPPNFVASLHLKIYMYNYVLLDVKLPSLKLMIFLPWLA